MPKKRRQFSPEQKAEILKRHLRDKVEISSLCEEYGLQPSVLYEWRQQLFENAAQALQPRRRRRDEQERALEREQRKAAALNEKLAQKEHVIAVLAERLVTSEKEHGEP